MKKITFLITICIVLVACAPSTAQTPVQPARQEAESTTVAPSIETASDEINEETAVQPVQLSNGVLITMFRGGHTLRLVDPLTGEDIPGYAPLELGRDGLQFVYSADGRLLATLANRNQLGFIDLSTWQMSATDLHFYEVNGLAFSPDGRKLAITYNGTAAKLALVDVATGTKTADITLPFMPRWNQVYFTPDNTSVVLYGTVQPNPYNNELNQPTAVHVALLETVDLNITWETELTGLLDGVTCEATACDKPEDPRTSWQPAVVMSQDGRSLYIVHANEDKLTTVSLTDHTVQTTPIAPTLSWLDRLILLTADTAYAKEFDFVQKSAVLSHDGSQLYVTGWHSDLTSDENGQPTYVERPLGLQVIDTATGTELASREASGNAVYRSPEGAYLLVSGWEMEQQWTEVVDVNTLETVKRLEGYGVWPARRLDGETIFLASQTDDIQSTLGVLDLTSFELVSTWQKAGYVDWVINR